MSEGPLKVVLIVGRGRSGSTILDNVLGGIEGFAECPFWSRILEIAHMEPYLGRLVADDVVAWQSVVIRQRHLTLPFQAAYGLPLLPRRNPPLPAGHGEWPGASDGRLVRNPAPSTSPSETEPMTPGTLRGSR